MFFFFGLANAEKTTALEAPTCPSGDLRTVFDVRSNVRAQLHVAKGTIVLFAPFNIGLKVATCPVILEQ